MKCVILGILIYTTFVVESSSNTSHYMKVCHQTDPKLDQCMKESLEMLRPHLADGISQLSIPPFEPLIIPEIVMKQGRGSINLQAKFKDIHIWGLSNFNLKDFHANLRENEFQLKIHFPFLMSISRYALNGQILALPMAGEGMAGGNYTNVHGDISVQGYKVYRQGIGYFLANNVTLDLKVAHVTVHLSRLFNGDEELGIAMNQFLNENWRHILKDMKPILEETIAELVKNLFNSIYGNFPLDEILPE